MNANNIGLIIQGPLLSIGKDGKNAHVRKIDMNSDRDYIHFDCRQNIAKIIENYGNLFKSILISTWGNELSPGDTWEGAKVVSIPDPGEVKRDEFSPRSRNKYRQFIGILGGIEELKKDTGIDYVLRIRTDQYLDLEKLINDFFKKLDQKEDKDIVIGVPFVRPEDFFVHDLYLISNVETLERFCNDMVAFDQFEFIHCVHREMIVKHSYMSYRNSIKVQDCAYFSYWPPCGCSRFTKEIFSFMFDKVFLPLDRSVFESVLWRGSKLSNQHIEAQYVKSRKKNIVSLPVFISTNWEIYHNFLEEVENKNTTQFNKIKIRSSRFFWKGWNKLRDLSGRLRITSLIYKIYK